MKTSLCNKNNNYVAVSESVLDKQHPQRQLIKMNHFICEFERNLRFVVGKCQTC
jgi:hypothetical protein